MTGNTRLVALGVGLLLLSSLLFLPTGVAPRVSVALAGMAGLGVVAAALGGRNRRTA